MDAHFDLYQFQDVFKSKAVHTEYVGGGEWETNGLDFSDYRRMATISRGAARRGETPAWALNDSLLRDTLIRYLEKRALLRIGLGDYKQRLERARKALTKMLVSQSNTLDSLCKQYISLKNRTPVDNWGCRILEQQIESLDTTIRFVQADCPGIVLRIVYLYHRLRWDCVNVAAELHLKPPHVRQILWRLDRIANPDRLRVPRQFIPLTEAECLQAVQLRRQKMTITEIVQKLHTSRTVLDRSLRAHDLVLPPLPEQTKRQAQIYVDPQRALVLWNRGESLEGIAERFVDVQPYDIRRALAYAIDHGGVAVRPLRNENGPSLAA